jgi:cytochrome c5
VPAKIFAALAIFVALTAVRTSGGGGLEDAPTGFDNLTNGLVSQVEFDAARSKFEAIATPADGLGPLYNAESCAACHASPIPGGASQVSEVRVGRTAAMRHSAMPISGSVVHDRAISPAIQAHVADADDRRGLRISQGVLGLGYIEAIDDATFTELAARQALETNGRVAGVLVTVPVLEEDGLRRVARFGWKNQHASLLSFVADAYRTEMGITNRLLPDEIETLGAAAALYDLVPDPEDGTHRPVGFQDIDVLTTFIRATKAPAADAPLAGSADARAGRELFGAVGCGACHIETLVTAPAGTPVNGGTFIVPPALGDKVIHPFGDFLLHDIDTGDGIPVRRARQAHSGDGPLGRCGDLSLRRRREHHRHRAPRRRSRIDQWIHTDQGRGRHDGDPLRDRVHDSVAEHRHLRCRAGELDSHVGESAHGNCSDGRNNGPAFDQQFERIGHRERNVLDHRGWSGRANDNGVLTSYWSGRQHSHD